MGKQRLAVGDGVSQGLAQRLRGAPDHRRPELHQSVQRPHPLPFRAPHPSKRRLTQGGVTWVCSRSFTRISSTRAAAGLPTTSGRYSVMRLTDQEPLALVMRSFLDTQRLDFHALLAGALEDGALAA